MELETLPFENVRERHTAMELILHDRIIGTEFFNFMCGNLLGSGTSRFVFEYKLDSRFVVKVDMGNSMANTVEWMIWDQISEYEKMNKWFAPVAKMSTCGRVMLQRKCKTKIAFDEYPDKVPDFFTDLKYQNWGKLNGKMVCMDYASTKLLEFVGNYKLVKAKWWDGR